MSQQAADDAVKYIIFLADANTLFDVALGIYDFDLVLAVAQNSQKVRAFKGPGRVHKLKHVLDRIPESTYRFCENSEHMIRIISATRLTIISTASLALSAI